MMRICFLPAWFYDMQGRGGGNFFLEQASALHADPQLSVDIFYPALAPKYSLFASTNRRFENGLSITKYQQWSVPKRYTSIRSYYVYTIRQAFKQYLALNNGRKPDLIHAHSFWGAFAAMVIRRDWQIPFIYTEHLSSWSIAGRAIPKRYQRLLPTLLREAVQTTAVSSTLASQLSRSSNNMPVHTIHNMVDTSFFSPPKAKKRQTNTIHLISIGDPWQAKGLDILIEAVGKAQSKTAQRLILTLVDKIPQREPLHRLIAKYSLEEQVVFTGRISRTSVRDLLHQQDVLVSASRQESFGITMIEALASGIPVIATQTAGATDIITPETGLLVPIASADNLAEEIINIAKGTVHFDTTYLQQYAHQAFGKSSFVSTWSAHYQKAIDKVK